MDAPDPTPDNLRPTMHLRRKKEVLDEVLQQWHETPDGTDGKWLIVPLVEHGADDDVLEEGA